TLVASAGPDQLIGGAGADRFQFGAEPWAPATLTDFQAGVDKIDLRALFDAAGFTGADPFAAGYLRLIADDAGATSVLFDGDGDLSGVCQPGQPNENLLARAKSMGIELRRDPAPTVFWDLFGQAGHPIRATVSEMGPLLLSRMLELNEVQEGVLNVVFRAAD